MCQACVQYDENCRVTCRSDSFVVLVQKEDMNNVIDKDNRTKCPIQAEFLKAKSKPFVLRSFSNLSSSSLIASLSLSQSVDSELLLLCSSSSGMAR